MTLSNGHRRLVHLLTAILAGIIAIPVVVVLAWFIYSRYAIWRYDRPFERLTRGATQEQVIALMGKPDRIVSEHETELAWRSGEREEHFEGKCVVQFRYIPWSPLVMSTSSGSMRANMQSASMRSHHRKRSNQAMQRTLPGFTTTDTLLRYDAVANTWTNLGSAGTGGRGNYGGVSRFGAGQLLITDGAGHAARWPGAARRQLQHDEHHGEYGRTAQWSAMPHCDT